MAKGFDPGAAAMEGSGIFGLPFSVEEAKVVVVPVPYAATTSYGGGAERGPEAILRASRQVDLYDIETGRPYEAGIAMLPMPIDVLAWHAEARRDAETIVAVGGAIDGDEALEAALARVDAISTRVNEWVEGATARALARGALPAIIGGDHSTPFGAIRAVAAKHPRLGILHVDAHADLRAAYEGFSHSHASIMHNVASLVPGVAKIVQVAIRDLSEEEHDFARASGGRIVTHFDAHLVARLFDGESWSKIADDIVRDLPRNVYVSFDIDGLDPTLCPHTGTPVPGGLSFQQACALIRAVVKSGRRIVGVDVNEVVPGPEGDEWDGNVAARLLYKLVGWMLVSNGLSTPPT
jgi:agmatinase